MTNDLLYFYTHISQRLWQVLPEELGDPVVLPEEDDVECGQEGMLVDPHVARHEVGRLLGPQEVELGADVELLAGRELVGVGVAVQFAWKGVGKVNRCK